MAKSECQFELLQIDATNLLDVTNQLGIRELFHKTFSDSIIVKKRP